MFGGISCCFGNWYEVLFVGGPNVFVKTGPAGMTGGTDALKAGLISALVNCAPLGNGALKARGIGAKDDLGTPVDVAEGEKSARAKLSIKAQAVDGYNDTGVLKPLRLADGG